MAKASATMGMGVRKDDALTSIYLIRHGDYDELVDGKAVENPGSRRRAFGRPNSCAIAWRAQARSRPMC